jgi:hypothetical protein
VRGAGADRVRFAAGAAAERFGAATGAGAA